MFEVGQTYSVPSHVHVYRNVSEAHPVDNLPCTELYVQVHDNVFKVCTHMGYTCTFTLYMYMTMCLRYVRKLYLYYMNYTFVHVCT